MSSPPVALAADVGGTKVILAVVHEDGSLSDRVVLKTQRDPGWVLEQCIAYAQQHGPDLPFGIAAAGVVAPSGSITFAAFIPWDGYPLQELLEQRLTRPVVVRNDVTAAAWGEHLHAPEVDNLVVIAIGTGVGGGAVVQGRLIVGVDGAGMEVAHIPVSSGTALCVCGHVGCVETVASGTAISRRYLARQPFDPTMRLRTAVEIVAEAAAGGELARQVITEAGHAIGEVAALVASVLDPDRIVLSGGFATGAGTMLLETAREGFARHTRPRTKPERRIVLSALPDPTTAALLGAGFEAVGRRELQPV